MKILTSNRLFKEPLLLQIVNNYVANEFRSNIQKKSRKGYEHQHIAKLLLFKLEVDFGGWNSISSSVKIQRYC